MFFIFFDPSSRRRGSDLISGVTSSIQTSGDLLLLQTTQPVQSQPEISGLSSSVGRSLVRSTPTTHLCVCLSDDDQTLHTSWTIGTTLSMFLLEDFSSIRFCAPVCVSSLVLRWRSCSGPCVVTGVTLSVSFRLRPRSGPETPVVLWRSRPRVDLVWRSFTDGVCVWWLSGTVM